MDPSANEQEQQTQKPQSSVSDVFAYAKTTRTKLCVFFGLLFGFGNGLMYPALAFLFSKTFSAFSDSDMMKEIEKVALQFLGIAIISFIFGVLQTGLLETAATEMSTNFKLAWFSALLRQDMAFFDAENISGTASTISYQGDKFKKGVGRKMGEGVQFFTTFIGGLIYAFYVSWKVSFAMLGVLPFMGVSAFLLLKLTSEQSKSSAESFKQAGAVTFNTVSNIRTVLSLNMVQHVIKQFTAGTKEAYQQAAARVGLIGLANGLIFCSFLACYLVLTLFGCYLIYTDVRDSGCDPSGASGIDCEDSGEDIFGALIGISFGGIGVAQIGMSIEAFSTARSIVFQAKKAIDREKNTTFKVQPDSNDPSKDYDLPKYEIDSSTNEGIQETLKDGNISFQDVSFRYPTRQDQIILKDFNLDIKPGSTIAFVGKSGCGKSSLINLIIRFYDPIEGSISIDKQPMKDLNIKNLRTQIGLVSQEPSLFHTTIGTNISYGNQGATQEQIEQAAKTANAHDFIESFPEGYDTMVGDKGAQLSGGQKQRIAIARAILKNPKLLLLDEATSALDSESEKIVQEALDKLLENSHGTHVIVAHRLSTIRNADAIAVVSEGKIVEIGTHDELMKIDNGHYRNLVETQAGKSDDEKNEEEQQIDIVEEADIVEDKPSSALAEEPSVPYLSFNNVTFSYPTRQEKKILSKFSLTIRKNETLALVGPSGCGKSSCISLIERFYDPLRGNIELEGVDIRNLDVNKLRSRMGLVQQEPILFEGTIAENIAMGMKSATMEQIQEAAKQANAHDFITSFPQGYQTMVGEGDRAQISGGQKQRIAIARAVLRKPEILLLDEATSALDSESEKVVQATLDELIKNSEQTVIVIAHRLTTIRNADRIAVIKEGRVRELGNHKELMSIENGIYKNLVDLQNSNKEPEFAKSLLSDKEESTLSESMMSRMSSAQSSSLFITEEEEYEFDVSKLRNMTKPDIPYYIVGAIGAMLTGAIFPVWGVVYGEMINLLYTEVSCDYDTVEACDAYYEEKANDIEDDSYTTSIWWSLIMVQSFIGYTLMFFGFGRASERLNLRVRDATFINLVRQEVGFFDSLNAAEITAQLQSDVNHLQAFSGQPIRVFVMNLFSVAVGVFIAFIVLWPVALMALLVLPLMGMGTYLETKLLLGADEGLDKAASVSGGIVVETLVNMRTVAALTLENHLFHKYTEALHTENTSYVRSSFTMGCLSGYTLAIQFASFGFLFWWGGWVIDNYDYSVDSFNVSTFALIFSLSGMGVALQDISNSEQATSAAQRLFMIIERKSKIDPLQMSDPADEEEQLLLDKNPLEVPLLGPDDAVV